MTNRGGPAWANKLSSPPRTVYLRWGSVGGPNFKYFLHVAIYSLFPLLFLVWLGLVFAWAAFGTTVEGHFSYFLNVDMAGGVPKDQMQVEYRFAGVPQVLEVNVGHGELHRLGMPDEVKVVPGKPLVEAVVPVRVLQIAGTRHAVAVFPWTWVWRRLIPPFILEVVSVLALLILHGDMLNTILRSYRVVKHGIATGGRLLGTHETGWWESSGEYSWSYIRRCYVDYMFAGPDGHEHRGCQLVLGEKDPAQSVEGSGITVIYNPEDANQHVMYEACAFRASGG